MIATPLPEHEIINVLRFAYPCFRHSCFFFRVFVDALPRPNSNLHESLIQEVGDGGILKNSARQNGFQTK